jgi:hypothetical protein
MESEALGHEQKNQIYLDSSHGRTPEVRIVHLAWIIREENYWSTLGEF